jgi:hypothetical protein
MTIVRDVLKLAVLGLTLAVLMATSKVRSCPPESGLVSGPMTFEADTDCGPNGEVVMSVEPSQCEVSISGAADVGLPARGEVRGTRNREIWLRGDAPLGVPHDGIPTTTCTLNGDGAKRFTIQCRTEYWVGTDKRLRKCGGELRRKADSLQVPAGPATSSAGAASCRC